MRTARMVPRALDTVDRWMAAHRTRVERRLDRLGTYLDAATEADKEDIMTERTDRHATIVIQRSFRAAPARGFAAWESAFFGQKTEADRREGWGEILDRLEADLERPVHEKEH